MVGLPARGKTHIAQKVARYLSWLGYSTRTFNVGDYRRQQLGGHQIHEFFRQDNIEGMAQREHLALTALSDVEQWLQSSGRIAIYDATNTTRQRRKLVLQRCQSMGARTVFIESICEDREVIEANIRDTKLRSPDYVGMDQQSAMKDFRARLAHYERAYEPIDESQLSYIKLIDAGRQIVINRIGGYLPSKVVYFLMNIHTAPRPIWLTRHGESADNMSKRLGGDSDLSERGRHYAQQLAEFLKQRCGPMPCVIWTSGLKRAVQTAEALKPRATSWRLLNEIDAGVCEGMTYEEIRRRQPDEYSARETDKFTYRYPGGESYADLIQRLEPIITEIERQKHPLMIVSHQAVSRVLYGYLLGKAQNACPHLDVPLHTVIELRPTAYGYEELRFALG
ncbi:MAG: 6-phosphofructo-2-kinase/fructose-2,6-bisphosphatase [Myxococcales bacterium]|nr:6-phosphofructo-2-kinase/fructose-2,6-bisphosphatase [Myxococcales bacterium]